LDIEDGEVSEKHTLGAGPSCPSAPVIPAGKLGILRQEGEITSIQWEMEPINNGALSWFDYETNLLTI
jgi:hypothetical protein